MTPQLRIPSTTTQRAHAATADVRRLTTALTGVSNYDALCLAEQARCRALDQIRALGPVIRRLKKEARG